MKKNNIDRQILGSLPVKTNRIVIAVVLIAIMFVLWLRVFLKGRFADEAGAVTGEQKIQTMTTGSISRSTTVSGYVKLPVIAGRNDVIAKDIFTVENWKAFGWTDNQQSGNVELDGGDNVMEQQLRKIAQGITIDAIVVDQQSGSFEAFIGNRVLSRDSIFPVKYDGDFF